MLLSVTMTLHLSRTSTPTFFKTHTLVRGADDEHDSEHRHSLFQWPCSWRECC